MATYKGKLRQKTNNGTDVLYPETSADMVIGLGAQVIVLEENGSTTAGTWLAKTDRISSLAEGQLFLYKIAKAGASTTTLNITANGTALGAKTIYRSGTTKLTTQYAVGSYIMLYYGGSSFTVVNDYDANSYAYLRQYQAGDNVAGTGTKYPILTRYNLTNKHGSYDTAYSRFHTDVTIDTSNGNVDAPSFSENGTALSSKYYLASNPSGFTSNAGTITGIKMNGASKGTSGVVDLGTVITDVSTKADLVDGKVPSSQLPSYVDDVLEYSAKSSFPATGESGKIYVDTATNKTYRWGGSAYVEISASLALGTTSTTAAAGNHTHANMAVTNADNNFSSDQTFKNITLYSASGDSPRLTFQRGTLTDGYNDWSIYDSGGYLHIQERGNGSSSWGSRVTITQTGANFNGTLTENSKAVATQEWVTNKGYTSNVGTVTSVNGNSPDSSGNVSLTIPSAVTESTVSGWGFTKNGGTVTSVRVQAGTGLSSSTSSAQSSSLNTTISIASGYKLPSTTEWGNLVTLDGAQSISGKKTFSSGLLSDSSVVIAAHGSASQTVLTVARTTDATVAENQSGMAPDHIWVKKDATNDGSTTALYYGKITVGSNELTLPAKDGTIATTDDIKVTNATVSTTGSGNAVTGVSISNGQIVATKGTTFLTSHQSLSNYVTLNSAQTITAKKTITIGAGTSGLDVQISGSSAGTNLTSVGGGFVKVIGSNNSDYVSMGPTGFSKMVYGSGGSSYSISLPNKSGTIALTKDLPSTTNSIVQWTGRITNLRTDNIDPKPGFVGTILYDKYAKKVRISGGFWAATLGDTSYSKWPIDKILAQVGLTSSNIRTPLDIDVGSAWILAAGYDRMISTWMTVGATVRYDVTSASGTGAAGLWFGRYWNYGNDASWGAFDVKQFGSDGLSCQFTAELEVY